MYSIFHLTNRVDASCHRLTTLALFVFFFFKKKRGVVPASCAHGIIIIMDIWIFWLNQSNNQKLYLVGQCTLEWSRECMINNKHPWPARQSTRKNTRPTSHVPTMPKSGTPGPAVVSTCARRHRGRIEQAVPQLHFNSPLHVWCTGVAGFPKAEKSKAFLKQYSLVLKRRKRKARPCTCTSCRELACKHLILATTGVLIGETRSQVRTFVLTNARTTTMKSPRSRCLMIKRTDGRMQDHRIGDPKSTRQRASNFVS